MKKEVKNRKKTQKKRKNGPYRFLVGARKFPWRLGARKNGWTCRRKNHENQKYALSPTL